MGSVLLHLLNCRKKLRCAVEIALLSLGLKDILR